MDASSQHSIDEAIARVVDGEAEPGDGDLVLQAVQESPELLRTLTGLLALNHLLHQQADPNPDCFVEALDRRLTTEANGEEFVARIGEALQSKQRGPGLASRFTRQRWWLAAVSVAAAVAVSLIIFLSRLPGNLAQQERAPTSRPASDSIAFLVNEAGARFAANAGPDLVSFSRGKYEMLQGTAHLRFRNGADVVLVAPIKFTILEVDSLTVEGGRLRALVPESAHGFVVSAPGVRFRDLGTEFGVEVDPQVNRVQLHVFGGSVEVLPDGMDKPLMTLLSGQSVAVRDGELRETAMPQEGQFPTADSISLRRWNLEREAVRKDADLVFYYPFIQNPANHAVLTDDAVQGLQIDGRISGAEWVTGRWPGKQALQFERPGDRVSLTIPGEFPQVTLAAWLKIDRLENTVNAVMNSEGSRPGSVHWQLDRRSNPASTWFYSDPKRKTVRFLEPVPQDRWVLWATTADCLTGQILHYVNGKQVCEARMTVATAKIKPGDVHLGHWEHGNLPAENRDFRGRIDELFMWRVVLSPERIARLAEQGSPVELLPSNP